MSECKHRNVVKIEDGWFCNKCLTPFVPTKTPAQELEEYKRIKKQVERMMTEGV